MFNSSALRDTPQCPRLPQPYLAPNLCNFILLAAQFSNLYLHLEITVCRTTHPFEYIQMPTRHDYRIGWICALPLELAAAQAMLDETHLPLPNVAEDRNNYII
jgi:hypothetical protein